MRHRKATVKLNMTSSHRKAMISNMIRSLFETGKIRTTVRRAREAGRAAEKMITLAKKNTLASRRDAKSFIRCDKTVKKLFSEIRERNEKRNGGYTRVLRAGYRVGDGSPQAVLELVEKITKDVKEETKTIKDKIKDYKKKQDETKTTKGKDDKKEAPAAKK